MSDHSLLKKEIIKRLKNVLEKFDKSGISPLSIKSHFKSKTNFKKLLLSLKDMEREYDEENFEEFVRDILNRLISDKVYYDKDNLKEGLTHVKKFNDFI